MWFAIWLSPVSSACSVSCAGFEGPPELVSPQEGASLVSRDAAPVLMNSAFATVELLTEDLEPVETTRVDLSVGLVRLIPVDDLAENTVFVLVDADAQTELGRFETGDGFTEPALLTPPGGLVAAGQVHRDLRPGVGLGASCGGMGEGVWLDAEWAPTTGVYGVQVIRADGSRNHLTVAGNTAELGWNVPCTSTVPGLGAGEVVEIRVRSIDEAGNASDWSEPLVTSAKEAGGGCDTGGSGRGGFGVALAAALLWSPVRPRRTVHST